MKLIDDLLNSVKMNDCKVKRVCIGLHWIAVESKYVGMAHTYQSNRKMELVDSGNLIVRNAMELAEGLHSWEPLEASLGLAALNSLIEPEGEIGSVNKEIMESCKDKTITVIGRFPFNQELKSKAKKAYFLEIEPEIGELPSYAVEEVIPKSDLVIITASSIINKTMPRLLELSKNKKSIVLGPGTPMNRVLMGYGADILGGVRVVDVDTLFTNIMQGVKKFRRIKGIEAVVLK
jgi:uncharacterized protein